MIRARLWIKDAVPNGRRQLFDESPPSFLKFIFERQISPCVPQQGIPLAISPVIVFCHSGPKEKAPARIARAKSNSLRFALDLTLQPGSYSRGTVASPAPRKRFALLVRPRKPGGEVGSRSQKKSCGLGEGDQRGTKPQPEAACVDRRIERFSFLVRERRDSESCRRPDYRLLMLKLGCGFFALPESSDSFQSHPINRRI